MKKTVFILNYAPHYREFIFRKIDKELNADLYFGNIPNSSIKKMNYFSLNNFKKEFKTIKYKSLYYYIGSVKTIFKPYTNYVLTGDPQIISNWLILLLGLLLRKNVYLWTHGWYGNEKGIKKIIKKTYFKLAKKLLLYGEYSKKLLIKEGFKEEKLLVIYNSLDYESQLEIKKTLIKTEIYPNYFKNNYPTLFYIGRIQESKKLEQILEAMVLLKKKKLNTNLAIVGGEDGNYNFRKKISEKKLENNVWLIGPVYEEKDIANYIYNANVCISPGNIGLTALHSLIYKTPVITHNNFQNQMPEFETIIEGVNGYFFEENNINDLAKKIEQILNSSFDSFKISEPIDKFWNPINQIKMLKKKFNDTCNRRFKY